MSDTGNGSEQELSDGLGLTSSDEKGPLPLRRRAILKGLASLGVGSVTFRRAIAVQAAQAGRVTPEMIKQAEWIAGLDFTEEERTSTARSIEQSLRSFEELRKVDVGYDIPPSLMFFPTPPRPSAAIQRNRATPIEGRTPQRPGSDEELAFLPVTELSSLVRVATGQLDRANPAVSREAQAVRPAPEVRRDPDRGGGAQAGRESRP